jgi:hypothetical protein
MATFGSAGGSQGSPPEVSHVSGTDWREEFLGGSPEAEASVIEAFSSQINEIQAALRTRARPPLLRRGFHAKTQAGVTNAEFRILPSVPAHLRVGPFIPGAVYPAMVRFSNASGAMQPDRQRDLRGLAIRVMIGTGQSQDFLLTNAKASHARDARQFMAAAVASAKPSQVAALTGLMKELGLKETVRLLLTVMRSSRRVDSLATESYWARAPIAWGRYAVRCDLKPAPEVMQALAPNVDKSRENYLREELYERLLRGPLIYQFRLQQFVDAAKTPIEDGTAKWKEEDSPPIAVAELFIPQQDLLSAEARQAEALVEAMEFNPWNAPAEFRPLGSLNRARDAVYKSSADFRAGRKGVTAGQQPQPVPPVAPPRGQDAPRGQVEGIFWTALRGVFGVVNRFIPWYKLPSLLGVLNLGVYREVLRRENQYDTYVPSEAGGPTTVVPPFDPRLLHTRFSEGYYNDLQKPEMGSVGRRFLRNVPLDHSFPERAPDLLKPSPREISNRLLKREQFVPATRLNLLAAAWIQFQIHDWVGHEKAQPGNDFEIPIAKDDTWETNPMRVARTPSDGTRTQAEAHLPPTYINRESHWWDGSQIYGSNEAETRKLRSGEDGKLVIDEETFLLPVDPKTGIARTGFTDNWWVGLSLMHTLFAREHNAICERLRADYADWPDDKIFDTARMVNTALMVKIHQTEWTPNILGHPTLQLATQTHWWGLQGRTLNRLFGRLTNSETISGIPGSATDHRGVSFALTEEFVAVYRHHTMMPDEVAFRSARNGAAIKTLGFLDTAFEKAHGVIDNETTMTDAFYSFGIAHPGAITLHNYPNFLRDLHMPDGRHIDLAAVDVLRDRERGIPRYNAFRKLLHVGGVGSFDEITSNKRWAQELRDVYEGDLDRVDPMVGMFAEDLPPGFGFSELAFRIFLVVASQRLRSDRFFTVDYTSEVYTPSGLEWIASNTMTTVLLRHYPGVAPGLRHVRNAFAPWRPVGV